MLEMLVVPANSPEFAQQSVNVFRAGEGGHDLTGMSGRNLAVSDVQSRICGCIASRTAAASKPRLLLLVIDRGNPLAKRSRQLAIALSSMQPIWRCTSTAVRLSRFEAAFVKRLSVVDRRAYRRTAIDFCSVAECTKIV
jgi:hypothetical protein